MSYIAGYDSELFVPRDDADVLYGCATKSELSELLEDIKDEEYEWGKRVGVKRGYDYCRAVVKHLNSMPIEHPWKKALAIMERTED